MSLGIVVYETYKHGLFGMKPDIDGNFVKLVDFRELEAEYNKLKIKEITANEKLTDISSYIERNINND